MYKFPLIGLIVFLTCFNTNLQAGSLSNSPLNIAEEDNSPSVFPYKLKVTNGSLTDNSDGTVSLSTSSGDAPIGADYLVGTTNSTLTAEIVVGTTPGGDLGGTWGAPSVDDDSHAHSAVTITEADPLALLTAGTDNVKDTHIDWGTGVGQVSPTDVANEDIGDITITTGAWAVEDDSHAHTTTTISGIDISADTNLTAGDAITLTDDDIDFDGGATPGGDLGGTWASPTIDDLFVLNSAADTMLGNLTITAADPALILNTTTAIDTDFWLGITEDAAGDDDDLFQIGDGTTPGTNPFLTIDTSGSVGIGTTGPIAKLDVLSGTRTGTHSTSLASAYFTGEFGAYDGLRMMHNNGSQGIAFGYTGIRKVGSNAFTGGTDLTIDAEDTGDLTLQAISTGKVGIGTATPNELLEVNKAQNANTFIRLSNTNSGSLAQAGMTFYNNVDFAGFALTSTTYAAPWTNKAYFATQSGITGGFLIRTEANAPIAFETDSVERMRILGTGNVGIGTTTPQSLLDVQGPIGTGATGAGILTLATKELTIVDGDELGRINFNAPLESDGSDAILAGAAIWAEADATFSATVNSTELVFGTATTSAAIERMRIDSAGYVGIGTAAPGAPLEVYQSAAAYNTIRFSNLASGGYRRGGITFQHGADAEEAIQAIQLWSNDASTDNVLNFGGGAADTNAVTRMLFYTAANGNTLTGTERMRIDSAGNVGIGTTNPNSLLSIAGPIAPAIANKTAVYTITALDSTITCDATTAAFAVTLPASSGIAGRIYTVKKIDSSVNAVTVDANASETVDDALTYSLSAQYKYVTVQSDGAEWWVIANN